MGIDRRTFLKGAAGAVAGVGVATVLPAPQSNGSVPVEITLVEPNAMCETLINLPAKKRFSIFLL